MSITDELREYAHDCCARIDDDIHAIADRIDAEHERMQYDFQREFDEWRHDRDACWVMLPKDANGEYIHFGDVLDQFGTPMTVFAMSDPDPDQGDCMLELITDGISDGTWVRARKMCHYHAPTVEDVLRECCHKYHSLLIDDMNDAINGVERDYIAPAEIIAEYAAKLQLREVDE